MEFLRVDGRQPDCIGCEYKKIFDENEKALNIYDLACPWGEMDYIEMAFNVFGIRRGAERKYYLKKIVKIHRMIKEHYTNSS